MTVLQETIAAPAGLIEHMLDVDVDHAAVRLSPARRIWLVGTGTSQHAAELGAWMLAAGARVVSITGQGGAWPEAVETVPQERSETYTVSYIAALVVLAQLAAALGATGVRERELPALPGRVAAAARQGVSLDDIPERLLVVVGVGPGAVTAREGALKLREAARLPAEGYEAEYLLHGSAVPLRSSDGLLLVQPCADQRGQDPDTIITSGWARPSLWRIGGPEAGGDATGSATLPADPSTV